MIIKIKCEKKLILILVHHACAHTTDCDKRASDIVWPVRNRNAVCTKGEKKLTALPLRHSTVYAQTPSENIV